MSSRAIVATIRSAVTHARHDVHHNCLASVQHTMVPPMSCSMSTHKHSSHRPGVQSAEVNHPEITHVNSAPYREPYDQLAGSKTQVCSANQPACRVGFRFGGLV